MMPTWMFRMVVVVICGIFVFGMTYVVGVAVMKRSGRAGIDAAQLTQMRSDVRAKPSGEPR